MEKYCIKHILSNGKYLVVLNSGWRYDGSMVIEADNALELEYKLAQARYDDRWVTMKGQHVLIGGNGRIKAGVGGRLKGRMFGFKFGDYDHGQRLKGGKANGRRAIRVYKDFRGRTVVKAGKKELTNEQKNDIIRERTIKRAEKLNKIIEIRERKAEEARHVGDYDEAMVHLKKARKTRLLRNKIYDAAAKKGIPFISAEWNVLKECFKNVKKLQPAKNSKALKEQEIIGKIAGGDKTKGSCVSVAFAYIANKYCGLDVRDFRGGESQSRFSLNRNIMAIMTSSVKQGKIKSKNFEIGTTAGLGKIREITRELNKLDENKDYFIAVGRHGSMVKKVNGQLYYLELQADGVYYKNGWQPFQKNTLQKRFGCSNKKQKMLNLTIPEFMTIAEAETFKNSEEFAELVGYLNTSEKQQRKGTSGTIR